MPPKKRKPAKKKAKKADQQPHNGTENGAAPKAAVPLGTLVPQPHGGAIRHGNPGNKGGGRPPEMLRIRSRAVFDNWLGWAEQESTPSPPCEKCGRSEFTPDPQVMSEIGKTSGRFGFPPEDSVSRQAVRDRVERTMQVIRDTLSYEDAERVLVAVRQVWVSG